MINWLSSYFLPSAFASLLLLTPPPGVSNPFVNTLSVSLTSASSQYIDFGNNLDQGTSPTFSISVWIRGPSFTSTQLIIGKGNWSAGPGFMLFVSTSRIAAGLLTTSPYTEVETPVSSIAVNTWYHVVWVCAGWPAASQTIYINGSSQTLSTVATNSSGSTATTDHLVIGGDITGLTDWNGYFNNFTFWNGTDLNSTQVTALYNSGSPPNMTTLGIGTPTAWWKLGNGGDTSSTFHDSSAGGYIGTGENTPTFVSNVP